MTYVLKIAKSGFDVETCEDKDLVFGSLLNYLKTKATATESSPATVAHGLSYVPIFFTSQLVSGRNTIIGDDYTTNCDATNLNISGGTTRYYLFYQEGAV